MSIKKVRFNIIKDGDGDITRFHNEYLFSDLLLPVKNHQCYEEMLQKEKEFAGTIYFQRCLDRRRF